MLRAVARLEGNSAEWQVVSISVNTNRERSRWGRHRDTQKTEVKGESWRGTHGDRKRSGVCLHVCLCEGARAPGTRITESCGLPCGHEDLNMGSLEKSPELLKTEPSPAKSQT